MSLMIALFLAGFPLLGAANAPHDTYSIFNTQVRTFHSDRVGIDYKLYIGLPRDYGTTSDSYPGVAEQKQGPIYKLNRTRDYTPSCAASDGYSMPGRRVCR